MCCSDRVGLAPRACSAGLLTSLGEGADLVWRPRQVQGS